MLASTEFVFVVKIRADNTPYIGLEPKWPELEECSGQLGLDLYKGTSLNEAKQMARFLNSNIKAVSYPKEMGAQGAGKS